MSNEMNAAVKAGKSVYSVCRLSRWQNNEKNSLNITSAAADCCDGVHACIHLPTSSARMRLGLAVASGSKARKRPTTSRIGSARMSYTCMATAGGDKTCCAGRKAKGFSGQQHPIKQETFNCTMYFKLNLDSQYTTPACTCFFGLLSRTTLC